MAVGKKSMVRAAGTKTSKASGVKAASKSVAGTTTKASDVKASDVKIPEVKASVKAGQHNSVKSSKSKTSAANPVVKAAETPEAKATVLTGVDAAVLHSLTGVNERYEIGDEMPVFLY